MTNFSGENLNAGTGGLKGGGTDSRHNVNEVAEMSARYFADMDSAVPNGYKQTEVGMIPEDWCVSTLMDITIDMLQGINTAIDKPEYVYSGVPILKANNVIDQVVSLGNADQISLKSYLKYNQRYSVKQNDFLFSNIGARLGTGALWESDVIATFAWNVMRIIPDERKVFPKFLAQLINSPKQSEKIQSEQSGSGMGFIPKATMQKLLLPLPKLEEQTSIANALSAVDTLISELEKLIAKKQAIKTATMQQLLTGRTRLPQFALREDGTKKGYKQSELGEVPEDWEVKKLGDIGQTIIGLTYSPRDVAAFGTLVLRSSNVQNNKLAYADNVYVNMELPERVIVKEGDILVCVRNGSRQLIGKCALIDKKAEGSAFGAFMSIFRSNFSSFIFYQFQSDLIQNQINEIMGATINQITNKDMSGFTISLPSNNAEQSAIATILSDMDSDIQTLEQRLNKTRQIKQGMMQELLTGKTRLI